MQFRHFKGGIYDFVCAAKLESDPTVTMIVYTACLLYTSPSPRDVEESRMPSSA